MGCVKGIALVVLAVMLAVGALGCGVVVPVETQRRMPPVMEPVVDDVFLTVKYGTVSDGGATFVLTNLSRDYTFEYSSVYHLQRYEEGGWVSLPSETDRFDILVPRSLGPMSEAELTFEWGQDYGMLPPGEYRVGAWVGRRLAGASFEEDPVGIDLYARFSL